MTSAPAPVIVPGTDERSEVDQPWKVVVWDDPVNTMSYVVYVFRKLFGFLQEQGNQIDASSPQRRQSSGGRERSGTSRSGLSSVAQSWSVGDDRAVSHFDRSGAGIESHLSEAERSFLIDALDLLGSVGGEPGDPAEDRLNVPAYLGSPEENEQWQSVLGSSLEAGRLADRAVFRRWLEVSHPTTLPLDEADAVVRVINETRLVLAARLGIDVASDYERLDDFDRQTLDYLGWLLEELTEALSSTL